MEVDKEYHTRIWDKLTVRIKMNNKNGHRATSNLNSFVNQQHKSCQLTKVLQNIHDYNHGIQSSVLTPYHVPTRWRPLGPLILAIGGNLIMMMMIIKYTKPLPVHIYLFSYLYNLQSGYGTDTN